MPKEKEKLTECGIYTNIRESGNRDNFGNKKYYATCKVCGTQVEKKYITITRSCQKCCHNIKKRNSGFRIPTVSNIGINDMPIGWMNQSKLNRKTYQLWKAMLIRTQESYWEKNPAYINTSVCEEWKTLSNFVRDVQTLENYDKWADENRKETYMLDKDVKGNGQKLYSKETCCFLTASESGRDVMWRNPQICRIFPKGNSQQVKITNLKTNEELYANSTGVVSRFLKTSVGNVYKILSDEDKYKSLTSLKGYSIEHISLEEYIDMVKNHPEKCIFDETNEYIKDIVKEKY